jgi:hypothetical protein
LPHLVYTAPAAAEPLLTADGANAPVYDSQAILDRCTLLPWIVDVVWSRTPGVGMRSIEVVAAPLQKQPDAHNHVPADAMLLRGDVFPASHFEGMTPRLREIYSAHYRAYLLWRRAQSEGKTVAEFEASPAYNEATFAERVERWKAGRA